MTILGPMLELLWIDVHATMYEQEQVTDCLLYTSDVYKRQVYGRS